MKKYFTTKNLGWAFSIFCAFMLIVSGISKVTASEAMTQAFSLYKLLPYIEIIGILEIVGALLLLYLRTSSYGALIISSVMTGAVAMHLSYHNGDHLLIPVMLGVCAWTGHCLRKYNL